MSWKQSFQDGIAAFQASRVEESLQLFNTAIELGGNHYAIYDSRSAAYDKLKRSRDALLDAKKVIQLAPDKWQGYARSAQLFLKSRRYEAAIKMADHALERVRPADAKRRDILQLLRQEAMQQRDEERERQRQAASKVAYHLGMLPVELCAEIFRELVTDDWPQLFILLRVCSKWRRTVCDTPSLWGTLVLSDRKPSRKAALWLQRSQGRVQELDIRRSLADDMDWSFKNLQPLAWHSLRVLRIDGASQKSGFSTDILPLISTMSQLREIELSSIILADEIVCRMQTLEIQHLSLRQSGISCAVLSSHTTTLRSLILDRCPDLEGQLFDVFEANPKLERLAITTTEFVDPSSSEREPLSVPLLDLTHLELMSKSAPRMLRSLQVPDLRTFILKNCAADPYLLDLASRGSNRLTQLTIQRTLVTAQTLTELLKLSPLLEKLELGHIFAGMNAVAETLASKTDLCPLLSHLDLSNCSDIKTGPLVRFVKARKPAQDEVAADTESIPPSPSQFPCVYLNGCHHIEATWIPWFRTHVKRFSCIYMTGNAAKWKR